MRIIAGRLKGRSLAAPAGQLTRPTADRVRQALFDVLAHAVWAPEIAGARIIDLFAGSGALGLEALSRGAKFCLFVETDDQARGAIRRNIEALELFGETRVHRRDATDLGSRPTSVGAPFDLVFLDPPYGQGLGDQALEALLVGDWLAPGALVVFERAVNEPTLALAGLELLDQRDWGVARVEFARKL